MRLSAQQVGALLQAAGGFVLIGLAGIVFLPSYQGGIAQPVISFIVGVTFCGLTLGEFDNRKRQFGTTVAAGGGVGLLAVTGYLFGTASGGLEQQLMVGAASIAAVGLTATALVYRYKLPSVTPELLQLGSLGPLVAVLLFAGLPPATDGPFRLIFFVLASGAVIHGVVVIGLAVLLGIKERRKN